MELYHEPGQTGQDSGNKRRIKHPAAARSKHEPWMGFADCTLHSLLTYVHHVPDNFCLRDKGSGAADQKGGFNNCYEITV